MTLRKSFIQIPLYLCVLAQLWFSLPAKANDECGAEVNLGDGGIAAPLINSMPIVSQVGGTCAFHTAAQLFDIWRTRYDQIPTTYSSPLELAYRVKHAQGDETYSASSIKAALKNIQSDGTCPRKFYNPVTGKEDDEVFYNQLLGLFLKLRSPNLNSTPSMPSRAFGNDHAEDSYSIQQSITRNSFETMKKNAALKSAAIHYTVQELLKALQIKSLYPLNPSPNLEVLREAVISGNFLNFIAEVAPPMCGENQKIKSSRSFKIISDDTTISVTIKKTPAPVNYLDFLKEKIDPRKMPPLPSTSVKNIYSEKVFNSNAEKALSLLNREFDKGENHAMPVGINYCATLLATGRSYQGLSTASPSDASCGSHASLVIGRRKNPNTNRCQFLIRNSFKYPVGGCYHKDWDCEEGKTNVWVDADILAKSMLGITRIE